MDNGKVILRFENQVMGSIDIYFPSKVFSFPLMKSNWSAQQAVFVHNKAFTREHFSPLAA